MTTVKFAPIERLMSKVQVVESGCWEFTGSRNSLGYGRIYFEGKARPAHRVSYELHRETIPTGMEIDHLCRNRACVNPGHLEVVTRAENIRRSVAYSTHCLYGHDKSGDNLIIWRSGTGLRHVCRTCLKSQRAARNRRRAERSRQAQGVTP